MDEQHEHKFEIVREARDGNDVVGLEERCTDEGCQAVSYSGTLIPVWPKEDHER